MVRDTFQPERCAQLLAALAAPERLKIVRLLSSGPHTVSELVALLRTKAVNLSHHLNVLREAGLITGTRNGRFVRYSLVPGILTSGNVAERENNALDLGCCRFVWPADA